MPKYEDGGTSGGPLTPYLSGFAEELRQRGYTGLSVDQQLRLAKHASRWLGVRGLPASAFTPQRVEEFCRDRRAQGYRGLRTPKAVAALEEFLRGIGVVDMPPARRPEAAAELLVERYREYLVDERGLSQSWVRCALGTARLFLREHPGLAEGQRSVKAGQVTRFCAEQLPGRRVPTAKNLAAGLRSFLRFLHLEGLVDAPLAQVVPPVAGKTGADLPRGVPPSTVSRLLACCDRRTGKGRRDYAALLLLARLGLRAGEVTGLQLNDIDWRNGDLVVRGKGGRVDRLPLPADVGAALAGYLRRGRPPAATRVVFLRAVAPTRALTPVGLTQAIYAACDRAGVDRVGAHRLRHTAATQLLGAGASLDEIGQVLRHRERGTTNIYAKVDFNALGQLSTPWPGGAA